MMIRFRKYLTNVRRHVVYKERRRLCVERHDLKRRRNMGFRSSEKKANEVLRDCVRASKLGKANTKWAF